MVVQVINDGGNALSISSAGGSTLTFNSVNGGRNDSFAGAITTTGDISLNKADGLSTSTTWGLALWHLCSRYN